MKVYLAKDSGLEPTERTALFSLAAQPQPQPLLPPLPPQQQGLGFPTPTSSDNGEEHRISGFVDCCVCCGRGAYVETTVAATHVAFRLEERQCGECCTSCNAQSEESIEMAALEAATWVRGSCCSRRALCSASPCLLLGPLCPLACLAYLLLWGESTGTAIELTSAGDLRPSERGPAAGQLQLPAMRYDEFWAALRRALGVGKLAPGAPPLPPSHHILGATSTLAIADSRVLELTDVPCCCLCGATRTLTHARSVQWARMPVEQCCACCGSLQLGLGAPALVSAPMSTLATPALLQQLKAALLLRPPAGSQAPPPATFTTTHPCACAADSTLAMDADFTTVQTPGQLLLLRTADVPFVQSERSGMQPVLGGGTLLLAGGLLVCYAMVGALAFTYSTSTYSCSRSGCNYVYRYYTDGASTTLWFILSPLLFVAVWWVLSVLGLVSCTATLGCCWRFSKVAVGTPGAAESEVGSSSGCCGGKSTQRKELYNWSDGGQAASAFIVRARELMRHAKALDRQCAASCSGQGAAAALSGAPKRLD